MKYELSSFRTSSWLKTSPREIVITWVVSCFSFYESLKPYSYETSKEINYPYDISEDILAEAITLIEDIREIALPDNFIIKIIHYSKESIHNIILRELDGRTLDELGTYFSAFIKTSVDESGNKSSTWIDEIFHDPIEFERVKEELYKNIMYI